MGIYIGCSSGAGGCSTGGCDCSCSATETVAGSTSGRGADDGAASTGACGAARTDDSNEAMIELWSWRLLVELLTFCWRASRAAWRCASICCCASRSRSSCCSRRLASASSTSRLRASSSSRSWRAKSSCCLRTFSSRSRRSRSFSLLSCSCFLNLDHSGSDDTDDDEPEALAELADRAAVPPAPSPDDSPALESPPVAVAESSSSSRRFQLSAFSITTGYTR